MEKKGIFFNLEFLFSFVLYSLLLLLHSSLMLYFVPFIALGLVAGFLMSWLARRPPGKLIRKTIYASSMVVIAWLANAVINSSFIYRDIVFIIMKGLFFLTVVFSFGSYSAYFLNYTQILSILLFLGSFILINNYGLLFIFLASGYAFLFLIIVRLKLYSFASLAQEKKEYRIFSWVLSGVFLACVGSLSLLLSKTIEPEKIKTKGFFLAEETTGRAFSEAEKEKYDLQDKVQKEVTAWIFKLNSTHEQKNTLFLLSSLVQESSYAADLNAAESDLLTVLSNQGRLLRDTDSAESLGRMIKGYIDKRVLFRLGRLREDIAKTLKEQKIIDRISVLNRINRLAGSDSYKRIEELGEELRRIVNKTYGVSATGKQLGESVRQFREWKSFQSYHRQQVELKDRINELESNKKEELKDITAEIDTMREKSESANIASKLKELSKETAPKEAEVIKKSAELFGLKKEMISMKEAGELEKRMESADISQDKLKEARKALNAVNDSDSTAQLLKSASEFMDSVRDEEISRVSEGTKEVLEEKLESFINNKINKITQHVQENNLQGQSNRVIEELMAMQSYVRSERVSSDASEIKDEIDEFFRKGIIPKESRDNLIQDMKEIEGLLKKRLEVKEGIEQERSADREFKVDYQRDLLETLQSFSVESQQRQVLEGLTEKLNSASTISEIEEIVDMLEKEIGALPFQWTKEDIAKARDLLKKAAAAKKALLQSVSVESQQRQVLEGLTEKLNSASTISEIEEMVDMLEKEIMRVALEGIRENQEEKNIKDLLKKAAAAKKNMFQSVSLESQQRQDLKELMEKLNAAEGASEIENVLEAFEKEMALSSSHWTKKDMEKIRDLIKKMAEIKKIMLAEEGNYKLRKEIDELENSRPKQARLIKEELKKLRTSTTLEEYNKNIKSLEESLGGEGKSDEKVAQEDGGGGISSQQTPGNSAKVSLRLYLPVSRTVLPIGESMSFKNVAVFKGAFIKDVSSELEWFSSDPSVASIDRKGIVHAHNSGTTEIFAKYRGVKSQKSEVNIVGGIPDDLCREIEAQIR